MGEKELFISKLKNIWKFLIAFIGATSEEVTWLVKLS
jgi:hypothetical protein